MTRRQSSGSARRSSSGPYARPAPAAGSTGLTAYMADSGLGNSFEDEEDDDQVPEMKPKQRTGLAAKALGAISFRKGKAAAPTGPQEVSIFKPSLDSILGITFEVPEDHSHKGVVVSAINPGYLIAKSEKIHVGDVVHAINGNVVTTPQEGANLLGNAKGLTTFTLTRAAAEPRTGNLLSSALSFRPGGKKKAAEAAAAPEPMPAPESAAGAGEEDNTTVVVSCSQLIVESKKIVGSAAGLDEKLDELYAALKAKTLPSKQALTQLMEIVGQTTVEQAGLVIANAQRGALADGWVEYLDKGSNKFYYYNVHTKMTTWTKPARPKPPPPFPSAA